MSRAIGGSGEYQRSVTTSIGSTLPIAPAAMVDVVRVPSAVTPSIDREPSDSVVILDAAPSPTISFCPAPPAIATFAWPLAAHVARPSASRTHTWLPL